MKTRGFSPLSPNDATYFVACFICTIKRRSIRLSYPLSGDFCPDGIFHQSFTLVCLHELHFTFRLKLGAVFHACDGVFCIKLNVFDN